MRPGCLTPLLSRGKNRQCVCPEYTLRESDASGWGGGILWMNCDNKEAFMCVCLSFFSEICF